MDEERDEIRELIEDIYKEKGEWLSRSIKRLYDAGLTVPDISSALDLAIESVKWHLHYDLDIDWEELR